MIVQVYEIQSPDEAEQVAAAGVDHIGVLVGYGEFPREIPPDRARNILDAIPENSRKLVLTLSNNIQQIEKIAKLLNPGILHLGTLPAAITPDDVQGLKLKFPHIKLMRSIPVIGAESILLAKGYDQVVDFILLDSHKADDQQVGATGLIHDWRISKRIVKSLKTPVILAGGLGPHNVADAIRTVGPAGVDSKTFTDKPGEHRKDLTKVREFVLRAKKSV